MNTPPPCYDTMLAIKWLHPLFMHSSFNLTHSSGQLWRRKQEPIYVWYVCCTCWFGHFCGDTFRFSSCWVHAWRHRPNIQCYIWNIEAVRHRFNATIVRLGDGRHISYINIQNFLSLGIHLELEEIHLRRCYRSRCIYGNFQTPSLQDLLKNNKLFL